MRAPHVVFGIPSFRGTPEREFVISFAQTQKALSEAKIEFDMIMLAGDPYLPKCRNRIVSKFLTDHPHATDFFFLDDDIGWSPVSKVVEFVQREEDIICGVYPKKQDGIDFPATLEMMGGNLIELNGLYEAHLIPTGFLRIKRHVLEKMAMASAKYYEKSADGTQLMQWNIFEARFVDLGLEQLRRDGVDDLSHDDAIAYLKRALAIVPPADMGQWWGEDFWFAQRWREMGGKVWVDPEISFTHRGSKAWAARFGDSVRATVEKMKEAS